LSSSDIDRRRLRIAFAANIAMFFVGLVGWYFAESTSLLADAVDMLADASAYIVAMLAIGRSVRFQRNAARWSGTLLILLGIGVIGEVAHRLIGGSAPHGPLIMAFAGLSLGVNGSVLAMLAQYRHSEEVHLKATWIDTRADVLVNIGVLVSGIAIAVTGYRVIDLMVGLAIGLYVIKEGFEIWEEADDDE
jgi:cation diffusion facilitator family transporter